MHKDELGALGEDTNRASPQQISNNMTMTIKAMAMIIMIMMAKSSLTQSYLPAGHSGQNNLLTSL